MNWDLIGHEWAVDLLREHVIQNQLRQAYLITGPDGVGRRTLALRLAQAVNCPQPIAPAEPCRTCKVCTGIDKMQYSDLSIVESEQSAFQAGRYNNPQETSKKGKAASTKIKTLSSQILIDQIRELQRTLILTPYQSRYRVALILEFERANENTANALLKTLEEPAPSVILILTAENTETLPPTIVSRCEHIRLRPVPIEQISAALSETKGLDYEKSTRLAHICAGRPGYAFTLGKDEQHLQQRKVWLEEHGQLLRANRVERFAYAEIKTKSKEQDPVREPVREKLREQLTVWVSLWRDVFLQASGADVPLTNVDQTVEIHALAEQFGLDRAIQTVQTLERSMTLLEKNVNPRLVIEVLLLDMPRQV